MKELPFKTISSIPEVLQFFAYLMKEENLNFHPDDAFTDYIGEDNKPTYTDKEAAERSRLLDECFTICKAAGQEIYSLSIQAFNEAVALYHNTTFHEHLITDKYKSSCYAYDIERVNTGRVEYWELTIVTTSLAELDGEEPGVVEHYSYQSKREAQHDILTANQYSTIEFDEL